MRFEFLKVGFIIIAMLSLLEIALEIRAHCRGWDTILFTRRSFSNNSKRNLNYGPREGFPFRSQIIPNKKPINTIRYWVASSSYGEDVYVEPDKIFPNILDFLLRDKGFKSQIINLSRAGKPIKENIDDLILNFGRWNPDYVILYQMSLDINDLSSKYLANELQNDNSGDIANKNQTSRKKKLIERIVEKTTLYQNVNSLITTHITGERILFGKLPLQAENEFRSRILNFIKIVRNNDSTPILCTFAVSHNIENIDSLPRRTKIFLLRYNPFLSFNGWAVSVERFNNIIRDISIEKQVLLIDLDKEISGKYLYFRDFVHFTKEGHLSVANVMFNPDLA